jgi:hypothetical protein
MRGGQVGQLLKHCDLFATHFASPLPTSFIAQNTVTFQCCVELQQLSTLTVWKKIVSMGSSHRMHRLLVRFSTLARFILS